MCWTRIFLKASGYCWRLRPRQIGYGIGRKGLQDDEIIPFLHQLNHPTFFTLDSDFYKPRLCYLGYSIIFVNAVQYESASFIRRLLCQRRFKTKAKRMGTVARISQIGITVWYLHAEQEQFLNWEE